MNILRYTLIVAALTLAACGGQRPPAGTSPYERPPIREVSEEQLRLDGMLVDALALQESGRTDQALKAYADLVAKAPREAVAWYEMNQLLLQRGWTDSAMACIRRAVDLSPQNLWYLLAMAQTQGLRGEARPMAVTWERIVALKPEVLEYHYELSNAYIGAGDIPAAIEVLNRVERRIGVTEPISLQKQRLWQAAGKPDKAQREVERLAASLPADKRYNAILAESHMQQKQYAKAKTYYDRILEADPDDPYIHIQLAEYYKALGQRNRMEDELLLGFANPQLDSKSKLQLLQGFYTAEELFSADSGTAFRLVDIAMKGCTDSAELGAYYGNILMYRHQYAEAVKWLRSALQRDSSDYALWEMLLICLTETDGSEPLIKSYAARAAALFPMHTLPHFLLGNSALEEKRYDDAIRTFKEAEKWGFSKGYLEAETYASLATAYYSSGQYELCWRYFDRALSVRPDDMFTLNNYAYYLAEQNLRLEDAERMSRRTIEALPDNANNLDTYAWILHLMGRNTEALKHMQRAVAIEPDNATFLRHLKAIQESLR